jgi:hypothetical protein
LPGDLPFRPFLARTGTMKQLLFRLPCGAGAPLVGAWWNRKRAIKRCYQGVSEAKKRSARDHHGLHVPGNPFEASLDDLKLRSGLLSLRPHLDANPLSGIRFRIALKQGGKVSKLQILSLMEIAPGRGVNRVRDWASCVVALATSEGPS